MASINKVLLLGNLGADPTINTLNSGRRSVNLSLATSRKYKNADGQQVNETEWHRIVLYGRQAEIVNQYLRKGDPLFVEGRLCTRKWQDKNGSTHYTTEIIADHVQFVSAGKDREQGGGQQAAPAPQRDYEDCPF